jgi:hypothetical protein
LVALEALGLISEKMVMPTVWNWADLPRITAAQIIMTATVYACYIFQWGLLAAFSVGLGFREAKDWPPYFGKLSDCSTVGAFWGRFWHGFLRQPAMGFGHYFARKLGIPNKSMSAYVVHLCTAFSLSAIGHILSIIPITKGHISVREVCLDMTIFFALQTVGVILETVVINLWNRTTSSSTNEKQAKSSAEGKTEAQRSNLRLVGYTWVWAWLILTGWWFNVVYIKLGVMEWANPGLLPVITPLLRWLRE